jgi:nucleotide-binding universal stress UspA family protein
MSYKTILAHVDDSISLAPRVELACRIAVQENAHLVGAATTGISQFIYQSAVVDMSGDYITGYIETLRQRAEAGLKSFDAIARRIGVASVEQRLIDDETAGGISLHARYSDLVVLGQTDPAEPSAIVGDDFPEFVVLHAGCPVLVVPYAGQFYNFGEKVLIAWDGGLEAKRAVHDAIPLLRRAALVEVAVFNPSERPDTHGAQPGADIALYLARHGIRVNVRESIVPHEEIGTALLSLAADIGAGMLVMGCFGHSRLREIMLGGVSRTILSSMTVPVLMSH